jgi:hypothetical protein
MSVFAAVLFLIAGAIVVLWFAGLSGYKALHVLAIVIGSAATSLTLGIVFERRRDGETLAAIGKVGAWIGVHSRRSLRPSPSASLGREGRHRLETLRSTLHSPAGDRRLRRCRLRRPLGRIDSAAPAARP